MNILVSWKDSLKTFLPKNLKMLLLVAFKSFVETLKILIKKFWWLLGLYFVKPYVMRYFFYRSKFAVPVNFVLGVIALFLIVLVVRPSIDKKTYTYFLQYYCHFLLMLIGGFVFLAIDFVLVESFPILFLYILKLAVPILGIFIVYPLIALLFFADKPCSMIGFVKSWWQGLKFLIYNVPFIYLTVLLVFVVNFLFTFFGYMMVVSGHGWFSYISLIVRGLSLLFFICFLAVYYTKRVHEQLGLYISIKK